MNELGIGASVHFSPPLHKQEAFKQNVRLKQTDFVCDHIMSLPMHSQLSSNDVDQVIQGLFSCIV